MFLSFQTFSHLACHNSCIIPFCIVNTLGMFSYLLFLLKFSAYVAFHLGLKIGFIFKYSCIRWYYLGWGFRPVLNLDFSIVRLETDELWVKVLRKIRFPPLPLSWPISNVHTEYLSKYLTHYFLINSLIFLLLQFGWF